MKRVNWIAGYFELLILLRMLVNVAVLFLPMLSSFKRQKCLVNLAQRDRRQSQPLSPATVDITAATMSILKGETVPVDVLHIKGETQQPVFALIGLRWGAFRDEWPLVQDVSVSLMAPRPRPPDLPPQKPPRPNLLYRILCRLNNYWSPPPEGIFDYVDA
ncbi:hypothetical protein GOODEAATRI_009838 [Goodea atripinnis]|uniref:Acylglycerol kinase C-terminal domain-containing protein n=1 Tax=Goodea atripinnis TaxID=208336 RepID=A0ABV0N026_9TELE